MKRPPEKICVAYLNNAPFIGGAQHNIRNQARLIDRRIFYPIVIIPEERKEAVPFFEEADVEVIRIPMPPLTPIRPSWPIDVTCTISALLRIVRRYRVDVIHSHMQRAGVLVPPVRLLTGVKFVWHICDGATSPTVQVLCRWADQCTCVSREVYQQYRNCDHGQFRLLYTGVFAEDLSPEELVARRRAVRTELGISVDRPVVGTVANFQYWKGIHIVIRAWAEVVRSVPDALVVHIGGGIQRYQQYEREVRQLARDLNVADKVYFLGYRKDALRYYPAFDLLAHAPVYEGRCTESFGHSIVEAMAHRLPVVTSACGGPGEIVKGGETGELVSPGDYHQLALQITSLLKDPVRRIRLGVAGYRRYKKYFTQEREVREYERVYLDLVKDRRSMPSILPLPLHCTSEMVD